MAVTEYESSVLSASRALGLSPAKPLDYGGAAGAGEGAVEH